jgi:archaetidylinositol phosphate synthase
LLYPLSYVDVDVDVDVDEGGGGRRSTVYTIPHPTQLADLSGKRAETRRRAPVAGQLRFDPSRADTSHMTSAFGGDKKHGQSILGPIERKLIDRTVGYFPRWCRSWQLTLCTIAWSIGIVTFGRLSVDNTTWLWGMSTMVFMQWFTDSFDGTLGKTRGEGLVKWGFFMDHFLDTLFAGSTVIGYAFLAKPGQEFLFQLLLLVTVATMALSFLAFAATNQFQIAWFGIGPTEVRIGYIALNIFILYFGTGVFSWGLPLVLFGNAVVLLLLAYRTHKTLWAIDKAALSEMQTGKD